MQDRGEKIVNLAREILRTDIPQAQPESTASRITLSFKMLCLATLLAAGGGSAVTGVIVETRRPLNQYERTELDALVFYTAKQKGLNEEALRHEVLDAFKLTSFDSMTARDFAHARAYLQNRAQVSP